MFTRTLQARCSSAQAETPAMTPRDQQPRTPVDKAQDVLCMTLHAELFSVTFFSLTWSSTLMCFCNRSWLSQQEPDAAIL